jgi:hypothetical protein
MREMGIVCYTVGCGISDQTELVYRIIANVSAKKKKKNRGNLLL